MNQVRLRNATGRTTLRGQLVKVSPKSNASFVLACIGDTGIIGTTAETVPNGNVCLINLINTVALRDIDGLSVRETAPPNPDIGDLWFW